jgi:hypothetical protein
MHHQRRTLHEVERNPWELTLDFRLLELRVLKVIGRNVVFLPNKNNNNKINTFWWAPRQTLPSRSGSCFHRPNASRKSSRSTRRGNDKKRELSLMDVSSVITGMVMWIWWTFRFRWTPRSRSKNNAKTSWLPLLCMSFSLSLLKRFSPLAYVKLYVLLWLRKGTITYKGSTQLQVMRNACRNHSLGPWTLLKEGAGARVNMHFLF